MSTAPVFFISHGAPTLALEPGALGAQLTHLGQQLQGASAVLVVSPHWQSREVRVMTNAKPPTVHDFGGFAPALYQLNYPANGHPALAAEAATLLANAGFTVGLDATRGLDHGAWVPLLHLLPQAHLPVFQVAMPYDLDTAGAYRLGQALAPLRERGVVIVGSGSMTHNLYEFDPSATETEPYATEFTRWVRQAVSANALESLIAYRAQAPHAERAHPTEEHFLPLLVAMGARHPSETVQLIDGGVQHSVMSMESYAWGLAPVGTA